MSKDSGNNRLLIWYVNCANKIMQNKDRLCKTYENEITINENNKYREIKKRK